MELTRQGAMRESEATLKELAELPESDPRELKSYLSMKWLIDYGRCLVLGIEVIESHGYPSPTHTVNGIDELFKRMPMALSRAKELSSLDGLVLLSRVTETFDNRMCVWLVEQTAQFSLDMWLTTAKLYHFDLAVDIGTMREEAAAFDEILAEHSQCIRKVDCQGLPRTYRGLIDPKLKRVLPWWLLGGLEDRLPKIHR
jgi:hypothetical protein